MVEVVVIGAGISGTACAYELAKAGAGVTLVDRYGPAAMASGWTLAGVRQSGRHPAELPLARAAVARWADLSGELGAPTHYRRGGNLRLARDAAEAEIIGRLVEDQRAAGLDIAFLPDHAAIRAVAPAISERALCASFCPSDGDADPLAAVTAYVGAAERAGARLRFGDRVLRLTRRGGRVVGVETDGGAIAADCVVVAAGCFGNDLLAPLGLAVPLETPAVTVVRSVALPPALAQVIGVANADCAGRQEANGRFRYTSGLRPWSGAIVEEATPQGRRPLVRATAQSVGAVVSLFGALAPVAAAAEIEAIWSGIIDLTPDALPVLDRPCDGLVVAIGFSGHGFCLGPVTGEILCDLALERPPRHAIEAFRLDRFAGQAGAREKATLHG